jgi:chromosome segregation ATPase
MDYVEILWKRKWLIIIPTFLITVAIGIWSFMKTPVWEVDAIIQPSKFLSQNAQGEFVEVIVADPKQVAGQINQASYNAIIAAELNIDLRAFPALKAENLKDTKLIRVVIRDSDINRPTKILNSLFRHLKSDFDRRIDVEIKSIDTQIIDKESQIRGNDLSIKDKDNLIELKKLQINDRYNEIKTRENDIKKKNNDIKIKELEAQSRDIEKDRIKKEIETDRNKLKISEERQKTIFDEMKSVKIRIEELEKQQQKALAEKLQGGEAIALLLYFSQVQENLRYHNALEERLSTEKITQENLMLSIRDKEEQLRQLDNQVSQINTQKDTIHAEIDNIQTAIAVVKTEIDKINNEIVSVRNEIDKIKNSINTLKSDIQLLNNKKARIDFASLVKEPTPSLYPVAPKKKQNVLIAGFLSLVVFCFLALFLNYLKQNRSSQS